MLTVKMVVCRRYNVSIWSARLTIFYGVKHFNWAFKHICSALLTPYTGACLGCIDAVGGVTTTLFSGFFFPFFVSLRTTKGASIIMHYFFYNNQPMNPKRQTLKRIMFTTFLKHLQDTSHANHITNPIKLSRNRVGLYFKKFKLTKAIKFMHAPNVFTVWYEYHMNVSQ